MKTRTSNLLNEIYNLVAQLKLSIKYQCCGGSLQGCHQKNIQFDSNSSTSLATLTYIGRFIFFIFDKQLVTIFSTAPGTYLDQRLLKGNSTKEQWTGVAECSLDSRVVFKIVPGLCRFAWLWTTVGQHRPAIHLTWTPSGQGLVLHHHVQNSQPRTRWL